MPSVSGHHPTPGEQGQNKKVKEGKFALFALDIGPLGS